MRHLLGLIFIMVFLGSCGNDAVVAPNVENIAVDFQIHRTEQELMALDTNDIANSLLSLEEKYSSFMSIYLRNVMGFTDDDNPQLQGNNIKGFIQDDNINLLYQATQIQYGDFDQLKGEFTSAFKFYKHYFPERNIPDLYTFISEYGIQRFVFLDDRGKDALGIGLDLFLGADYPYQDFIPNNPAFSNYLIRRFNKDHLVKRSIGALVEDILGPSQGNNLLEKMVHNGKKLYIIDHLLPFSPDSIIMEYTEEQLDWCEDNEIEMWAYLLKEDLFYESDMDKINKLINPSPSSPGMPKQAPGRTGNFIGWKIVEAYMQRHPEKTLTDLVAFEDAQKILEQSKYKPKK